jgi:hypothetical protein
MSQPTQASLGKQFKIIMLSVRALATGYIGLTITISVVVGLVLGLVVLGWWLWPVKWDSAKPASLRADLYQPAYLQALADSHAAGYMTAEQVALNLGEGWTKKDVDAKLDELIKKGQPGIERLSKLKADLDALPGDVGPQVSAAPPSVSPLLLIIILLVVIVIGVLLVLRLRSGQPGKMPSTAEAALGAPSTVEGQVTETQPVVVVPPVSRAAGGARPVEKTSWAGEATPPLAQYVTTYALGDDRYDMSFSIETATGDFLGECGVGISETIGTGNPDKVTALEVWLFDKNDIRTVTKVLMSEHAYNDSALRAKLAPKGEASLIKKGDVVTLETQTLKVNARIDDLGYGSGGLPNNSFFQQVTIELAAWSKPA